MLSQVLTRTATISILTSSSISTLLQGCSSTTLWIWKFQVMVVWIYVLVVLIILRTVGLEIAVSTAWAGKSTLVRFLLKTERSCAARFGAPIQPIILLFNCRMEALSYLSMLQLGRISFSTLRMIIGKPTVLQIIVA